MLQVRDGDVEKFGVLFERHHSALFNFFVRLTSSHESREDLVQEMVSPEPTPDLNASRQQEISVLQHALAIRGCLKDRKALDQMLAQVETVMSDRVKKEL